MSTMQWVVVVAVCVWAAAFLALEARRHRRAMAKIDEDHRKRMVEIDEKYKTRPEDQAADQGAEEGLRHVLLQRMRKGGRMACPVCGGIHWGIVGTYMLRSYGLASHGLKTEGIPLMLSACMGCGLTRTFVPELLTRGLSESKPKEMLS